MLTLILLGGLLTSLTTMMFLSKFNIRKVLYFEAPLDFVFDLLIPIAFYGTFVGMMVAIVAGVANSIIMHILKHYIIGYSKPTITKHGIVWIDVPPSRNHKR